jgi:uncharacterized protein YjbI with pentapeptide repeats
MSSMSFEECNFQGANFSSSRLSNPRMEIEFDEMGMFLGCVLDQAIFTGALLKFVRFGSSFDYATSIRSADLQGARFMSCVFDGIDMSRSNASGADFSGSSLRGASLVNCDLSGANLSGVDLEGADLSGANLTGAIGADHLARRGVSNFLRGMFGGGTKLRGATMPDGSKR